MLAIGGSGQFQVADGEQSTEKAQEAALQGCFAKMRRQCRVYASGNDIVWSKQSMPLPTPLDLRTELLGITLDAGAIPLITTKERRTVAERVQAKQVSHALALSTGRYYVQNSPTRQEAVRVAVERCSFIYGRPCLILGVDGFLTVQI